MLHASSEEVARIENGAPATVTAADLSGTERFNGRVTGVLNQINPGSTDFQVKVLLQNPQQQLRPGMVIQGNVATLPIAGIRVPVAAFTDDNHDAVNDGSTGRYGQDGQGGRGRQRRHDFGRHRHPDGSARRQ